MEGFVKGGFDLTHKLSGGSELYGALTGVGERTYNAPPPLVGGEASSFGVEDAYIGWRSGSSIGSRRKRRRPGGRSHPVQARPRHADLRRRLRRRLARRLLERRAQGVRNRGHWPRQGREHHHRSLLPGSRRTARERFGQQDLWRQLRILVERGQHARRRPTRRGRRTRCASRATAWTSSTCAPTSHPSPRSSRCRSNSNTPRKTTAT